MVFTAEEHCGTTEIDVYVVDENGYYDYCTVTLTLNGDCEPEEPEVDACSCAPTEYTGWAVGTCNALPGTDEPVGVIYDVTNAGSAPHGVDYGSSITSIHPANWTIDQIGQVFGIALDGEENVYLAASDVYDTEAEHPTTDAYGAGQIFKASANNDFIAEPFVELSNTGGALNGIGNIVYCRDNSMLYASNLEDGKIYRINASGDVMESYDPWTSDDGSAGIADASEQVWAIGLNIENGAKKLYFPRVSDGANGERAMYSIALNADGSFPSAGSESVEFDGIMGVGLRISDVAFNTAGDQMLFAERGSKFLTGAHDSKTLRYTLNGGSWSMTNKYFVGGYVTDDFASVESVEGESSAGGVDFGATSVGSEIEGCDQLVWTSMNYFEGAGHTPSTGDLMYGMQGIDVNGNNAHTAAQNPNHATDIVIDYDGVTTSNFYDAKGDIGDVELFRCAGATMARMAIAGYTVTETGNGVRDAEVNLMSIVPEYPTQEMTDANGGFAFNDNPAHEDYTVSVTKDDDHSNGVSTLDLVLIQRHIIGLADLG